MLVLLLLCLLCALEGFRIGMWIGRVLEDAERWLEAYLDGASEVFWVGEVRR
jgi:hypothetical protein